MYIVDHQEQDLYEWCILEYTRMMQVVGQENLIITNMNHQTSQNDTKSREIAVQNETTSHLPKEMQTTHLNVLEYLHQNNIPINQVCLLDSESTELMEPADSKRFSHFLLGGILGDVGEFDLDQTKELRKHGFPTRNLGRKQMTTDTALETTFRIVHDGIAFDNLDFVDDPEVASELESKMKMIMPFRYLKGKDEKPILPVGIVDILMKEQDAFF